MSAPAHRPRRSCLYMPGANPRALEKAKSLAADTLIFDLEDAVDALPKGLDEPMTPHGNPFSERQQRRLSLVRGIAHQPRALLIDRALDGLGLSEDALDRLLDELFAADAPWTLLVVSDEPRVRARCAEHLRIADAALEAVS